jgi:hypothetical protein
MPIEGIFKLVSIPSTFVVDLANTIWIRVPKHRTRLQPDKCPEQTCERVLNWWRQYPNTLRTSIKPCAHLQSRSRIIAIVGAYDRASTEIFRRGARRGYRLFVRRFAAALCREASRRRPDNAGH